MQFLQFLSRRRGNLESVNLYTVWKFSSFKQGTQTELFFTDKKGSVVIEIPYEDFKQKMRELEPPIKSIIE